MSKSYKTRTSEIIDTVSTNLPQTTKESDGILSTIIGFFNNVVLYPVKKANISFKYKLEEFENDIKEKIKNIPTENLQVPSIRMSGPILEALKYTYDEEELREMFENLLVSSIDSRCSKQIHPAYVEAIKQMSGFDAQVFKKIKNGVQLPCVKANIAYGDNSGKILLNALPDYFIEELYDEHGSGFSDPFLISTSIQNLGRLGLIEIHSTGYTSIDYNKFEQNKYFLQVLNKYQNSNIGIKFKIKIEQKGVELSDYGKTFADVCLKENK